MFIRPKTHLLSTGLIILSLVGTAISAENPLRLWYDQPAQKWVEALPVGNGRLGAMVFGGVEKERLQLNEDTVWDGHKRDRVNPEALKALPQVQKWLFEGKNKEATELAGQKMMGIPERIKSYQSLADLRLTFHHDAKASNYRRELDLDTGIARVSYKVGTAGFEREVFAGVADDVIVMRICSDQPGRIGFDATLDRQKNFETKSVAPDKLILSGWCDPQGVKFGAYVMVINEGGTVTAQGKKGNCERSRCRNASDRRGDKLSEMAQGWR